MAIFAQKRIMITIVWRGAGILVPIITIGITLLWGWLADDPTPIGGYHLKWCLLISGILFGIMGIGASLPDENEEEDAPKKKFQVNNSFMFIPIGIWGVILIGISITLFFTGDPRYDYKEFETVEEYIEEAQDNYSEYKEEKEDNFEGLDFKEKYGLYTNITTYYKRAIAIDKENFKANFQLGKFLFEEEEFEDAETYLERAVSIDSTNNDAVSLLNKTSLTLDNMLPTGETDEELGLSYLKIATRAFDKENYMKSDSLLTKSIELFPTVKAYDYKGRGFYRTDKYKEALSCFDTLYKYMDDKDGDITWRATVLAGMCEYYLDNEEKAIERLTDALKYFPKSGYIYNKRATVHKYLNHKEEACKDFNKALELKYKPKNKKLSDYCK